MRLPCPAGVHAHHGWQLAVFRLLRMGADLLERLAGDNPPEGGGIERPDLCSWAPVLVLEDGAGSVQTFQRLGRVAGSEV